MLALAEALPKTGALFDFIKKKLARMWAVAAILAPWIGPYLIRYTPWPEVYVWLSLLLPLWLIPGHFWSVLLLRPPGPTLAPLTSPFYVLVVSSSLCNVWRELYMPTNRFSPRLFFTSMPYRPLLRLLIVIMPLVWWDARHFRYMMAFSAAEYFLSLIWQMIGLVVRSRLIRMRMVALLSVIIEGVILIRCRRFLLIALLIWHLAAQLNPLLHW